MPLFVGASESYDTDAWEVDNLKKENAKLREERDHWHVEQVHAYGNWEDAHKRAIELEAENTKLRELVRIMHGELVSCEDNGYVCGGHKFDERVRELGVEE